jgi:hypothetical protein
MLQEHHQNPDRLLAELDFYPVLAQFPRAGIELERPESDKSSICWIGHGPGSLSQMTIFQTPARLPAEYSQITVGAFQ